MTLLNFSDLQTAFLFGFGCVLAFGLASLFVAWAVSAITGLYRAAIR